MGELSIKQNKQGPVSSPVPGRHSRNRVHPSEHQNKKAFLAITKHVSKIKIMYNLRTYCLHLKTHLYNIHFSYFFSFFFFFYCQQHCFALYIGLLPGSTPHFYMNICLKLESRRRGRWYRMGIWECLSTNLRFPYIFTSQLKFGQCSRCINSLKINLE